jgi:hypothetical protein
MAIFPADFRGHYQSNHLRIVPMAENHSIHKELKEIFRQAKREKSAKERLRLLREGIRKMAEAPDKCFWPGVAPQYRDDLLYIEASAYAWDYIERKIYGKVRGKGTAEEKAYDPDKGDGSPIALWNISCKGKYEELRAQQQDLIHPHPKGKDPDQPFNIDDLSGQEDDISVLELIREEFETDPTGELSNSFVRQNPPPPITAQAVLLKIYDLTSRGEKWTNKILAEHFKIKTGTMNSAWSLTLLPLLREIGDRLKNEMI